jgi:hypothetical protein
MIYTVSLFREYGCLPIRHNLEPFALVSTAFKDKAHISYSTIASIWFYKLN